MLRQEARSFPELRLDLVGGEAGPRLVAVVVDEAMTRNPLSSAITETLEGPALEAARLRTELGNQRSTRDRLLSSVAHDLRNPLNTFAMSTGLLRDDLETPEFDRTRALSLVGRMERATARMEALIAELLEASSLESIAAQLIREPVQVANIARAAIAKAKALCAEKGVTIDEGSIDEDVTLTLDRARTEEALLKLFRAALRAVGQGGTLRLGVERVDGDAELTLRGMGPRTSLDESRGGLALLIGHGLMAAQGGTLRIESTPENLRIVVAFPMNA